MRVVFWTYGFSDMIYLSTWHDIHNMELEGEGCKIFNWTYRRLLRKAITGGFMGRQ